MSQNPPVVDLSIQPDPVDIWDPARGSFMRPGCPLRDSGLPCINNPGQRHCKFCGYEAPADMPEPEGISDEQLAELDTFMGNAVYGGNLSCVEADQRTRWAR